MRFQRAGGWVYWWVWFVAALAVSGSDRGSPTLISEVIFAPEARHNHASCVVEAPDGTLLVAWFNGSGERQADDVKLQASRRRPGSRSWKPRFTLWDTPGFPDCNPSLQSVGIH